MNALRFHRRLAFAAICLTASMVGPASAQVIAKQGVADPDRIQFFRSPMILEFPSSEFIEPTSGAAWRFRGIERFDCDGAHFEYVSLSRSGTSKRGISIEIEGRLAVGPSYDREAKVVVELLVDGSEIGRGFKAKIDAEERKTKPFRFSFRLSPEASVLLEQSGNTVMRVTLYVPEA